MTWLAALAVCAGMRCEPGVPATPAVSDGAACPAVRSEVGGPAAPADELASIVAGEASMVPAARLAVACTALADWREEVPLSRWYGRAVPGSQDRAAVEAALSGGCGRYPRFRLVGNMDDWHTWQRLGMVIGDPPWRWERGPWAVVATP